MAANNFGFDVATHPQPVLGTFSGAATITPGATTSFVKYTSHFVQLTTGLHTLSFIGTTTAGDTTTFVDGVKVTAVPKPVTLGLFGLATIKPVSRTITVELIYTRLVVKILSFCKQLISKDNIRQA